MNLVKTILVKCLLKAHLPYWEVGGPNCCECWTLHILGPDWQDPDGGHHKTKDNQGSGSSADNGFMSSLKLPPTTQARHMYAAMLQLQLFKCKILSLA